MGDKLVRKFAWEENDKEATIFLSPYLRVRVSDPYRNPLPNAQCRIVGNTDEIYDCDENGIAKIPLKNINGQKIDIEWGVPPSALTDTGAITEDNFEPESKSVDVTNVEDTDEPLNETDDYFYWNTTCNFNINSMDNEMCRQRLANLGFSGETLEEQVTAYQIYYFMEQTGNICDIRNELIQWHDGGDYPTQTSLQTSTEPTNESFEEIGDECTCPSSLDNYPFKDETFQMIESIKDLIKLYSSKYDVPPVAVAGAIADEYNTREGMHAFVDWIQDSLLMNILPNFAIEVDAYFGFDSKLLNATKHDIGIGNIKVETAKQIYEDYQEYFENKSWDYNDICDYILTNEGTVHFAALVIRRAKDYMVDYVNGYSDKGKEAVYITYYKQGDGYIQRFESALLDEPTRRIQPGEGCRTCLQRERFMSILGL